MAKANYKKYTFYVLCNSLAVMLFFIFSTLYFNADIVQGEEADSIKYALGIPSITLVLFTVFFISQAHGIFIKKRKSEFGLFMILGMTNRDLGKLLLLENGIIAAISITLGLLCGTLSSRLAFFLLLNYMGLSGVSYQLSADMFLSTITIFLVVFLIAVGRTLFLLFNQDINLTLKSDRVSETIKMKNPVLGMVGVLIIISSILGVFITYTGPNGGDYLIIWTVFIFMGLYLALNQFTSSVINFIKKDDAHYYPRMVPLSNLDYKFKQLTSTLMLVSVMIMVTVLYNTILLFTYTDEKERLMNMNPYDIAFIQSEHHNNLTEEELYAIVDQDENPIEQHITLPVYTFFEKYHDMNWGQFYHVMSDREFSKLRSTTIALEDKEFIYYLNHEAHHNTEGYVFGFHFPAENENEGNYIHVDTIVERNLNHLSNDFVIVNQAEFERIKENREDGFESTIHLINVVHWDETAGVVDELKEIFTTANESSPSISGINGEESPEKFLFQVESKADAYQMNMNINGLSFFVFSFLSILFLFGSFVILYLNIFSTIDKERVKYSKLTKIGLTGHETKRMIAKELAPLFFTPVITGVVLSFLFIVAMATDVGGVVQNPEIMVNFIVVAGIYLLMQVGFYLYSRKKMVSKVIL